MIPNLVNLVSAFFGALYFLMNAENINTMPICSLVLFQNLHLFMINSALARYSNPKIEIFSFDMETGCMGFFDPRIAFIAFVPFGIFCSIMGSAGYVISLLFYSPLVVSNCYLVEPFIAQILGYVLGID